jgi:ankyrin repeat protein
MHDNPTNADALFVLCIQSGNFDDVKSFLAQGEVNVNKKIYDMTPLMNAACSGHVNIVKALLDHKVNGEVVVDVNAKDNYGITALMNAACFGHVNIVKALLDHKVNGEVVVDVNAKDNDGITALFFAAKYGHAEIAKLLIRRGADPNLKNAAGETALDIASDTNMKKIIKEEWVRIKLAPVAGAILGTIITVGCAVAAYALSAYGALASSAVSLTLAGAAIGGGVAFFLGKTYSQGIENIAYEVYKLYDPDASPGTAPTARAV